MGALACLLCVQIIAIGIPLKDRSEVVPGPRENAPLSAQVVSLSPRRAYAPNHRNRW
jgi:hypothetical protein